MSKFKDWIKAKIPTSESIQNNRFVKPFAPILKKSPDYWHFTRGPVAKGCAMGVFGSFMPIPLQMIITLIISLPLRANLILALGLLWINNPLTMVPIYWFAYLVGAWVLQEKIQNVDMHLSWHWLTHELGTIWEPFLLGCAVTAIVLGVVTYVIVYFGWRVIESRLNKNH